MDEVKKDVYELKTVIWGVIPIVNYRGVLVTKIPMGYQVFNKKAISQEEVDEIIDNHLKSLEGSLINPDTTTFSDGNLNITEIKDLED